jgi:hypothetical protein
MKALRNRACRVACTSPPTSLRADLDDDWYIDTSLPPIGNVVLDVLTIGDDDHDALLRLATVGARTEMPGWRITILHKSWVRIKQELMQRQQQSLTMVNLKVG